MFKINDAHARSDAEKLKQHTEQTARPMAIGNFSWKYLLDIGIVVVMGAILFWGATSQFSNHYNDATRYQCYAIAFWQGKAGIDALGLDANSKSQCAFLDNSSSATLAAKLQARHFPNFLITLVKSQSTTQPFHALPPEYPFLTLVAFSLPLLAPFSLYQVVFAILMALVAGLIYFVIKFNRSTGAAIAFAFYLALGSWALAETRFDLITAALTLGAVILAAKARWNWAFALLALATMLKFYPVVLVIPFLIAQQVQYSEKWTAWRRWSALGLFVGICVLLTAISLVLNVANTLVPFSYFLNRPIQVESLPGVLLWLGNFAGRPVQYTFIYQSLNFTSSLSSKVSLLSTGLLVAGLLFTWWLQWRGKLDIFTASLMTLLVVMVMGKVFSPQYLMWVTPLIAYVGKANWRWLLSWGVVCLLTLIDFPIIYVDLPHIEKYYGVIAVRDALILLITCLLLFIAARRSFKITAN
ncbi:MAG TPA: glycosyltransferase family 87 protein [Ktedonobacteraceae bacterium]|nr:glycosyltransferase family 87 protein [Ktedonobacteraceae bacterium]